VHHTGVIDPTPAQERSQIQGAIGSNLQRLNDALPLRTVYDRFAVAQDEGGPLVGGTPTYFVLGEDDKGGVLPVVQRFGRQVEGGSVSLYLLERLDLDKAARLVAVLHHEVWRVASAVAEIKAQRLMPKARHPRTEGGSIDEVTFKR
jgi:hypothetical protein